MTTVSYTHLDVYKRQIIMFHPLLKKEMKGIITIQLNELKNRVAENGIQLQFTDYLVDYLLQNGYDPTFGARPLKRLIQKAVVNELSKKILQGNIAVSYTHLDVYKRQVPYNTC